MIGEKHAKLRRKIAQIPQSIDFRCNYLSISSKPTKTPENPLKTQPNAANSQENLPNDESFASEVSETVKNSRVLSSRLSNSQFFHYKNSFLNEKIMRFNAIKNQESFRTNQTEYIEPKPLVKRPFFNDEQLLFFKEGDEEDEKLDFLREKEVKFTDNSEIFHENREHSQRNASFALKDENFTVDSRISDFKLEEIARNLDFHDKRKNLEFFSVDSSRNRYEVLVHGLFSRDLAKCVETIEEMTVEELNFKDFQENTPLFLAIKLARRSPELLEIIKKMVQKGADPNISDKSQWNMLDEAVNQGNIPLVVFLFDAKKELKRRKLLQEEQKVLEMLSQLPDFSLEMRWEFDSSVIPFFTKLAPSDTFKLWKCGESIRLDYNLVGINGIRAKKRDMSLIFNPTGGFQTKEMQNFHGNSRNSKRFWIVNRTKKTFTNPLQEIDVEEKKKILCDILASQPVQGNFTIKNCSLNMSKTQKTPTVLVGKWATVKYDFTLFYEYSLFSKEKHAFPDTYNDYLQLHKQEFTKMETSQRNLGNSTLNNNSLPANTQETVRSSAQTFKSFFNFHEKKNLINNKTEPPKMDEKSKQKPAPSVFPKKIDWLSFIKKPKKNLIKKSFMNLWISKEFPLKFKELFPILDYLSNGNLMLSKLNEVLNTQDVSKLLLEADHFPVKLQIPFNYTIKANISFTNFEFLDKNKDYTDVFCIPRDTVYQDRKLAQKILERQKKRVILGNLLI